MRVGYIGLGLMGKSIAGNILKGGFPLMVHNRTRARWMSLSAAERAGRHITGAGRRRKADVVFTNLPDTPDVEKVVLGRDGHHRRRAAWTDLRRQLHDQAGGSPHHRRQAGREEMSFLDAPVSGGDIGARNGTLTIMVGGDGEALEKVMPGLPAMGKTVTHVGDCGAGQVAKAANQIMVAAQMVAMGELLSSAKKAGVDPQKVVEAIKGGAAQCWTLDVKPPRLFAGNRSPGFKAHMMDKDLKIVLDTARAYGMPLPSAANSRAALRRHARNGHARPGQLGRDWRAGADGRSWS